MYTGEHILPEAEDSAKDYKIESVIYSNWN